MTNTNKAQIVLVADPLDPKLWTSVYLCPNTFTFYNKIPNIIRDQTSVDVVLDLIEFNTRIVLEKWHELERYFSWLIGHKDAPSDPDAHDSLLFDDDTFSRSRRHFWAINYLTEMNSGILGNITQLEPGISVDADIRMTGVERKARSQTAVRAFDPTE